MIRCIVISLLCVFASISLLAQDAVNLRPPMKLAKDQTLTTVQQSQVLSKVTDAKSKELVKDLSQDRTLELVQTVLEVDDKGLPTKLRLTVTASLELKATMPKEEAFEQKVQLKAVSVDLERAGSQLTAKTETIESREMKSLSSPELYLLRRAVRDAAVVFERQDLLLLPAQPAALTAKLQPTLAQLAEWGQAANASGRLQGRATDASFRIAELKDGMADVRGAVQLLVPVDKKEAKAVMTLSMRIDTASGLVRRRVVGVSVSETVGQQVLSSSASGTESTAVATDKVASPRGVPNALGWAAAKDASTWRDSQQGLGLELPREYTARAGGLSWDVPGGGSLSLEVRPRDFLPTLEQVLQTGIENLQREELKLKDIKAGEPFGTADGLHAVLLRAQAQDGKTQMLVLLVADGFRTIALTAAVPAKDKDRLAELEKVLKSLRVGESVGAGATSRPAER